MNKILILANNSIGLHNFRFELIERLIAEAYEVHFALPESIENDNVKRIEEVGGRFVHTSMNRRGMNPFEDLKLINNYKQIIKNIDPDIILTYTIKPNIYGNYVANKLNIPVITNITGIGTSLATGRLKEIIKYMYKYACAKSTYTFFQNKGNRNFFISNKLVNKEKTILIPGSGVNMKKFKPMGKNNKDNIIRFLFIGRLMKDKGIEEYLSAANRVTKEYGNVEFQILGSYEEEKYKEIINNKKNEQIKYLGRSNDVRQEIKEADCIVNPSYHEGMSNVLLEGAAMGKPLIASNIPGCKEIIDDGENGFLFEVKSPDDLHNKIVKFIELSQDDRIKMGKHSREKVVKEFDRKIVVDTYMEIINKILNK